MVLAIKILAIFSNSQNFWFAKITSYMVYHYMYNQYSPSTHNTLSSHTPIMLPISLCMCLSTYEHTFTLIRPHKMIYNIVIAMKIPFRKCRRVGKVTK